MLPRSTIRVGCTARSFVTVESLSDTGRVVLAALKPAGNPLAGGRLPGAPMERVTAQIYEATGRQTRARLRLWAPVTETVAADLLERPAGSYLPAAADGVELDLTGASIRQLLIGVDPGPVTNPEPDAVEPFQPVYSRYWLHNTGPAPIGNLPVAVHLDPPHAPVSGPVTLTVAVVSDLTEEPALARVSWLARSWLGLTLVRRSIPCMT